MPSPWNRQEAQAKLSQVVKEALSGLPQTVNLRGKPAVVVISAAAYRKALGGQPLAFASLGEALLAMPRGEKGKET